MTKEEANKALVEGVPVEYDGIRYKRINAISWRVVYDNKDNPKEKIIQAELQDERANAIVIAQLERISLA